MFSVYRSRGSAFVGSGVCPVGASSSSSVTSLPSPVQISPQQVQSQSYQGSVADQAVLPGVLPLSLDDAIARDCAITWGLSSPRIIRCRLAQPNCLSCRVCCRRSTAISRKRSWRPICRPQGLRISGFPAIIGPYGYQDFRAESWDTSLINVAFLRNYMASKHYFAGTKLSVDDARN